jgi:hypothetical protein
MNTIAQFLINLLFLPFPSHQHPISLPGLELRPLHRPARSQSLYLLSYLGSIHMGWNICKGTNAELLNSKAGDVYNVICVYSRQSCTRA